MTYKLLKISVKKITTLAVILFICSCTYAENFLRAYVSNYEGSSVSTYDINLSAASAGNIQKIDPDNHLGILPMSLAITKDRLYAVQKYYDRIISFDLSPSGLLINGSRNPYLFDRAVDSLTFGLNEKFAYILQGKSYSGVSDEVVVSEPNSLYFAEKQSLPFYNVRNISLIEYMGREYAIILSDPKQITPSTAYMMIFPVNSATGVIDNNSIADANTGDNPLAVKVDVLNNLIYVICGGTLSNEIWVYRFADGKISLADKIYFPKIVDASPKMDILSGIGLEGKTLLYVVNGPEIYVYEHNVETKTTDRIQLIASEDKDNFFTAVAINPLVQNVFITQSGVNRLVSYKVTSQDGRYGYLNEQSSSSTGYRPSDLVLKLFTN